MHARDTYEQGCKEKGRALSALESKSRGLSAARLCAAALAVALVGGGVWGGLGRAAWAGLGVVAAGFVALVVLHARVHDAVERARAGLRFHERGLARLNFEWDALSSASRRFQSADHPFSSDLDVFGRASLMQLIDATETRSGEERLAKFLAFTMDVLADWPHSALARQEAARDLSTRSEFREELAVAGAVLGQEPPDTAELIAWSEEREPVPAFLDRVLAIVAWLQPAIVFAVIVAGRRLGLPTSAASMACVLAIGIGLMLGGRFAGLVHLVSAHESAVARWRAMFATVERENFAATLLVQAHARFESENRRASDELRKLENILGFANARHNEVFRFLIGPLLMWDIHCAFALRRWRARAGPHLRTWIDSLAEVEALASLGAFAFEHPEFAWPELTDDPMLEGRALGHPLIPALRRVGNDVHLPSGGRALVVTGSNMSGKSTLLRAMGLNAVLAFAGAPVCASALRVGPLRVVTSMRVEDSLEAGASRFYAELRRLRRVLDLAREATGARVLFLLDEILHGTNSRERIVGACAVVRELIALGALGAVSTHDLGITALEAQVPGSIENAHFEEQVQDESMTFDYVLRPGVVRSSNALRLIRAVVGIDVPGEGNVRDGLRWRDL